METFDAWSELNVLRQLAAQTNVVKVLQVQCNVFLSYGHPLERHCLDKGGLTVPLEVKEHLVNYS